MNGPSDDKDWVSHPSRSRHRSLSSTNYLHSRRPSICSTLSRIQSPTKLPVLALTSIPSWTRKSSQLQITPRLPPLQARPGPHSRIQIRFTHRIARKPTVATPKTDHHHHQKTMPNPARIRENAPAPSASDIPEMSRIGHSTSSESRRRKPIGHHT